MKVGVERPDRPELCGRVEDDNHVRFRAHFIERIRRSNRHRKHRLCRAQTPDCRQRGLGRRPGRQTIIDNYCDPAGGVNAWPVPQVSAASTLDLHQLAATSPFKALGVASGRRKNVLVRIRLAQLKWGVPKPDFPRSILAFQEWFVDEQACLDYLFECRWPEGFACPRCGGRDAYPIVARRLWQCVQCRYQVSVTAGTVMHKTRLSLRLWFWAAYLMATGTPGMSARQLQRQLALSRYDTAWTMLHKLRRAMVAPDRGLLEYSSL